MSARLKHLVFGACFFPFLASAENHTTTNVFFGFDFVLHPIAIKWACGGEAASDLQHLETLMAAFPEDAERAVLPSIVDAMLTAGDGAVSEMLGGEFSDQSAKELRDVALPLNIAWVTPAQLDSREIDVMPGEQRSAWDAFYRFIETLQ